MGPQQTMQRRWEVTRCHISLPVEGVRDTPLRNRGEPWRMRRVSWHRRGGGEEGLPCHSCSQLLTHPYLPQLSSTSSGLEFSTPAPGPSLLPGADKIAATETGMSQAGVS